MTNLWLSIVSVFQAGDLYEKIRNYERALHYYCKGGAFRKGESVNHVCHIKVNHIKANPSIKVKIIHIKAE